MHIQLGKLLLASTAALAFVALTAFGDNRQSLNGTWMLVPTSGYGAAVIQESTVTINDREHNIYISRNFTYEGGSETVSYSFTTDSREHASIRQGKTFKSKANWDGNVLKVTTIGGNSTERELYSLRPDGLLMLVVERPGHPPLTLYFQHQ